MSTPNPPAATVDRSVEIVERLLKLPEKTRLDLAHLLLDSLREGFTSLKEAEERDRELIRKRVEQVVKGEVPLLDAEDVIKDLEQRYARGTPT